MFGNISCANFDLDQYIEIDIFRRGSCHHENNNINMSVGVQGNKSVLKTTQHF